MRLARLMCPPSWLGWGLLVTWITSSGCVIDRTGMSQPAARDRELMRMQQRVAELEMRLDKEVSTASVQIQDVRKDSEINQRNLANSGALLDVVLAEVQASRGTLEAMERKVQEGDKRQERVQSDLEFQIQELDRRIKGLEQLLGLVEGPAPTAVASASTSPVDPAADALTRARASVQGGNPKLALALLKDYPTKYPQSEGLEEAHFLYAEALFKDGQYKPAIPAYQVVVEKWPTSSRLPAVMLGQGLSFIALGEVEDGKVFLAEVVRMFPASAEAKTAQDKLTELSRSGAR